MHNNNLGSTQNLEKRIHKKASYMNIMMHQPFSRLIRLIKRKMKSLNRKTSKVALKESEQLFTPSWT